METQNGNGSSRGVGGQTNAIEVRLAEFCQHCLSLDEKIVEQAVKVLKETKHLFTHQSCSSWRPVEEAERYWFACICLVVKRLEEKSKVGQGGPRSNEMGLILCQTVRLAKLDMEDFFKELARFIVKAGPILSRLYGADWENYLEAKELQANINLLIILSRHYNRVYKEFFLTHDANEKQSRAASQRNVDMAMTPTKKITSPPSPYQSPMPRTNGVAGSVCKITSTPGTFAMTPSEWLRTTISPHLSVPSARLELFLASCDEVATNDVKRREEIILKAIFPDRALGEHRATGSLQSTNLMDNIWAEQRRKEALKLYYRVLEAICVAESQHTTNLTFLTCERFHRCMLTCSAEVVLVTHTTVSMLFPAVQERTGITAFDLVKGIGTFVIHEKSLPRELRWHLKSMEERLLESSVWERGSAMYDSLTIARPSLSTEIHRLALLAAPMPSLESIAMNNYSLEYVDNAPGNFPVSPIPVEVGQKCAESGIAVFFRKMDSLAAVRINGVIERLQPSQQHLRENTYRLFQQILNHQTSLFFNRHIDQIILCCLFGIAKISKVNLTFKEIIKNIQKQTHSGPQVFSHVFVDWSSANHSSRTGQGYLDIVRFYNEVFVPTAKPLLVEVGPAGLSTVPEVTNNEDGPCPASPVSLFPRVPDMSPRKVSAEHNVYVSPMRISKIDALISQGSESYYACVRESTQALQTPSKDLADISKRLNSGRKIRGALNFDDPDAGLVSNSMVANSLNLQNESSGSSSGTPMKSEQPDS